MALAQTKQQTGKSSPAKSTPAQRLLDTATALFATNGIRAVGVDRILAESGVARASLYSAYGSKDGLITAYLEHLDRRDRSRWDSAVADESDPLAKLLTFFDLAIASAPVRNFRGCQYLNATTEFPGDATVHTPVRSHREWMRLHLVELLTEAEFDAADALAAKIQLVYDGALAGSKFDESEEPIRLGRVIVVGMLADARA